MNEQYSVSIATGRRVPSSFDIEFDKLQLCYTVNVLEELRPPKWNNQFMFYDNRVSQPWPNQHFF